MLIGYIRNSLDPSLDADQEHWMAQIGCERLYADQAGARGRPGLAACLKSMKPGDALAVWKLSVFKLGVGQLIRFVEEIRWRGFHLSALSEHIDTTTKDGWCFFGHLAALRQMERELIRECSQTGLVPIRARGRRGGRPRALNEQQVLEARKLLEDPDNTVEDVAAALGVHRATVYRRLAV